MRINTVPVTSYEIRWFLEGSLAQQDGLKHWFETAEPWPRGAVCMAGHPAGNDGPAGNVCAGMVDVHLVIPGASDMGVKWREGLLQVKGRMNAVRTQRFCGRFHGRVERWVKWSYDDLSAFYRTVFAAPPRGIVTVPVRTERKVRKVRLDPRTGRGEEVAPATRVEHGMTVELTDIEVNGTTFCSLGFEAFPADSSLPEAFIRAVDDCLTSLRVVNLAAANSQSFPAWLATLTGCNARPVAASTGSWRVAV